MTFQELGLGKALLDALDAAGYSEPTPIQAGAIPPALAGKDVLGIAQTGTGKTASFTLPLIERLSRGRAKARMPRSLIIEPTRELAAQVAENFEKYAANTKLTMALLIGGVAFGPQEKILNQGADVLIATPGRLLDMIERGKILLLDVQIMVVDEADRMLDMGFIPDIEKIFSLVPPRRQTLFFSATMPKEIQSLVSKFLKNPERVEVSRPATTGTNIRQLIARVKDKTPKAKRDLLRTAIGRDGVKNGIIFCNRKRDVDTVARSLSKHGFSAAPIHGDLDQSQRTKTLERFKSGELRFLVASDVAARGLDIPAVSHVFNYDVPHHADDYVHRIGRTGRAGLGGEAVTLAGPLDAKSLDAIEALIGHKIETADFGSKAAPQKTVPDAGEADAKDGDTKDTRAKDAESGKPSRSGRGGGRKKKADEPARSGSGATTEKAATGSKSGKSGKSSKGERKQTGFGDQTPDFFNLG
ncbi:DEAD/DEAH box helicase [Hyphobacterium marinum]|uniref:DEAD/DEAH box helicase n=1 Tax=Hyphobacterium marinum TaxID=3116574 RepID=A0ABU7M1A0_9PROT|nr:DEAD/DEAH box helicase [Hyphobacterium sp. Y6023]MEE2567592.1 DEAD/DEAH box helicase [Hyphobacterium sp. Y6023]